MTPTQKKLLHDLKMEQKIPLKDGRLWPRHIWAIREGYAYARMCQDEPADVIYIFREKRFFLFATEKCMGMNELR